MANRYEIQMEGRKKHLEQLAARLQHEEKELEWLRQRSKERQLKKDKAQQVTFENIAP